MSFIVKDSCIPYGHETDIQGYYDKEIFFKKSTSYSFHYFLIKSGSNVDFRNGPKE